ncbi:MAG: endonuclease I, partial [Candidatus Neomarinimicrobiota bacterium]
MVKKHNLNLIYLSFIFAINSLKAGIPSGYYDSASGLDDDALKAALNDIIDGHTEFPYTSSGTDVWDILKVSDRDPNNSNNV